VFNLQLAPWLNPPEFRCADGRPKSGDFGYGEEAAGS
jgi:hypothetical protein